jgi:hypothetical protein
MHVHTLPLLLSLLLSPQEEQRLCVSAWKIKPPGQRGPPWDAPKQPHVENVMTGTRVRRARVFFLPLQEATAAAAREVMRGLPRLACDVGIVRCLLHARMTFVTAGQLLASALHAHNVRVIFVMNNAVARELPQLQGSY